MCIAASYAGQLHTTTYVCKGKENRSTLQIILSTYRSTYNIVQLSKTERAALGSYEVFRVVSKLKFTILRNGKQHTDHFKPHKTVVNLVELSELLRIQEQKRQTRLKISTGFANLC